MRISGWIVVAAIAVVLVLPSAASARSASPHQAAVDVYVEEFPTAVGLVTAEDSFLTAAGTSRTASASGGSDRGGLIGLGLVLVGVTAVIVVTGVRRERQRS